MHRRGSALLIGFFVAVVVAGGGGVEGLRPPDRPPVATDRPDPQVTLDTAILLRTRGNEARVRRWMQAE